MGNVFRSTFVTYSTVKIVEVNDRRLRLIHLALSLGIVIYTILLLALWHQGIRFESISGVVNAWEGPMVPSGPTPDPCNNAAYDWQVYCHENITAPDYLGPVCSTVRSLTNSWYVSSSRCIQFDGHSHTAFKDASAVARTYISRYYYNCTDEVSSSVAPASQICLNRTYHNVREGFFLKGVDDFSFMMQHSVSSSFLQDFLPPTTIRDFNNNVVKTYPRGSIVGFMVPIRDWLRWGGGSLERSVGNLQAGDIVIPGPKARATGVIIELRFTFSNYRKGSTDSETRCDIKVKAIEGLWGFEGGEEATDGVETWLEQYNSIQLRFVMGGEVGEPDGYQVVTALIGSTVLLSLSRLMTDFIGRTCLHEKAKFRAKTIETHYDLRRQTEIVGSIEVEASVVSKAQLTKSFT